VDSVQVYPNPVGDVLHVKADSPLETVVIYNLLGQRVLSSFPKGVTESIDVSGFESGLYLVRVAFGDRVETFRVLFRQ
jgi:hypothetical protein